MSNPTPPSSNKPNPYFPGIIYNPTDYISIASSSAITYGQATTLFIQKTIADIVTGVTNFTNGLTASSIFAKSISATCNLWTLSQTGVINIGTYAGRNAIIHIGDGDNNVAGSAVHINNGLNAASNVQILNGTGSTGIINLGSATSTTQVNSILTLARPIVLGTVPTANTQLGYTVFDTITNTGNITSFTAFNIFSSYVSLPAGVWLITFSVRIKSTVAMTIQSYNIYGVDNVGGVAYGQTTNTYPSSTTDIGNTGTFVISSSGSSTYNVTIFLGYTTGTASLNLAGAYSSNVQRTRIG